MSQSTHALVTLTLATFASHVSAVNWLEWWTYDGISGPSFWGLINPEWSLCNQGLRQSPIDIRPSELLHDPGLQEFSLTPNKVKGRVINTGHTVTFQVDSDDSHLVNISGGSLSYNYQVTTVVLHWGEGEQGGSEHSIGGHHAALEVQLLGYNGQLYSHHTTAARSPNGVVGIAILVKIGSEANLELERIIKAASKLKYAGTSTTMTSLSLTSLIPITSQFITYEGSLTQPGCQESVTWIVPNKPVYITAELLQLLSTLMQGTSDDPRAPLAGNIRPSQASNGRVVRTNINFDKNNDRDCQEISATHKYQSTQFWAAGNLI